MRKMLLCAVCATAILIFSGTAAAAEPFSLVSEPSDGEALEPGAAVSYVLTVTEGYGIDAAEPSDGDAEAALPCTVRVALSNGLTLDINSVKLVRTAPAEDGSAGVEQFIFGNDGFVLLADRLYAGDRIVFVANAESGACSVTVQYADAEMTVAHTLLGTAEEPAAQAAQASAPAADTETEPPIDSARTVPQWYWWAGGAALIAVLGAAAAVLIRLYLKRRAYAKTSAYIRALDAAHECEFSKRKK